MDCKHRGDVMTEKSCPTCKGVVMVKVFACTLHQLCTERKPVAGVTRACKGCEDYAPRTN